MSARIRSGMGWLAAAGAAAALAATAAVAQGQAGASAQGQALRKAFSGPHTGSLEETRVVGRIGLRLVDRDSGRLVPPDHVFHSGDRFRFEITSNRPGWLYVLHASPDGKVQQLWPRGSKQQAVRAREPYLIPPSPARFRFNEEIGRERFYVAIRSAPTPPALEAVAVAAGSQPAPEERPGARAHKPSTRITNFMIRDPFGEQGRSVLFDPGTEDADPYLYFSAAPGDPGTNAMVEFQLRHGD